MTNLKDLVFKLREYLNEGGEGSGNFGHAGRPGEVGGSSEGGGTLKSADDDYDRLGTMDQDFDREFYRKKGKIRIGGDPSKTYHGSESFVHATSRDAWELAYLFAGAETEKATLGKGGDNEKMLDAYFSWTPVHKGAEGTWTQKFADKRTGDLFRIKAVPNGKGFYGTDYYVSKIKK